MRCIRLKRWSSTPSVISNTTMCFLPIAHTGIVKTVKLQNRKRLIRKPEIQETFDTENRNTGNFQYTPRAKSADQRVTWYQFQKLSILVRLFVTQEWPTVDVAHLQRMKSMVVLRTTTYRLSRSMVCMYLGFQAVSTVSFSHTMCLLSGLLCSCFLPSSVFLVHDVCTSFHASVQVNRNLVEVVGFERNQYGRR